MSKKSRIKKGRSNVKKNVQVSLRNMQASPKNELFERFEKLNHAVELLKGNRSLIIEKVTLVRDALAAPYSVSEPFTVESVAALRDHLIVALDKLGQL